MIRTIILKRTSCLISFEHSNKIVQVSKLCVQIFWPKLFDPKLMHLLSFSSLLLLLLLLIWKWCWGFCFDREVEEISRGEVLHCGHPLVGLVVERLNQDDDDNNYVKGDSEDEISIYGYDLDRCRGIKREEDALVYVIL